MCYCIWNLNYRAGLEAPICTNELPIKQMPSQDLRCRGIMASAVKREEYLTDKSVKKRHPRQQFEQMITSVKYTCQSMSANVTYLHESVQSDFLPSPHFPSEEEQTAYQTKLIPFSDHRVNWWELRDANLLYFGILRSISPGLPSRYFKIRKVTPFWLCFDPVSYFLNEMVLPPMNPHLSDLHLGISGQFH